MTNDVAKIRIKLGVLEVDYEGNADFLNNSLTDMVEKLSSLYKTNPIAIKALVDKEETDSPSNDNQTSDHSTSTIATLLHADSGPELIRAAAANLTFTQGSDTFTRQDLIKEMKKATSFFKKTYVSNLSSMLNRLVKDDRLRHIADNTYALSTKEKQELGLKLAA